jgi:hypothetical protein
MVLARFAMVQENFLSRMNSGSILGMQARRTVLATTAVDSICTGSLQDRSDSARITVNRVFISTSMSHWVDAITVTLASIAGTISRWTAETNPL